MSTLQLEQVRFENFGDSFEPIRDTMQGQHTPHEVDYDELHERFLEGNDTYRVVRDRRGMTHELILFNADQAHKAVILKPSTSFSSGLKNPANVLETALSATMNPGAAYLYWGSDGNYPTGHMSDEDRRYRRQTGRYTRGDGSAEHPYEAVDSIKYFAEMLTSGKHAPVPTHGMADQEAGRVLLGVMTALEGDSIKGAYFNGIDGVSPGKNYVAAPFLEDMQSRIRRRRANDQTKPGELTPYNIKDIKQTMPSIYRDLGKIAHLAPLPVFIFPRDVRDKIGLTLGFRGHKDLSDLNDHALYHDMSAALQRHDATFTLQFNEGSQQHDLEKCITFSQEVMNHIPSELRTATRGLRLFLGKGTWTKSTDEPLEATRVQRLALPDITHMFKLLAGGRLFDHDALGLESDSKAA